ncbi:benzoate 4-monooxygenase cytochrome-like protein P450 [Lophiostoma macrostomum CBS 122681]|uniref:Benzoate 4-monooxygenase cytochrome-like protein P450 n=1 Tax=Lophiostoma macrostomum CBS 122681 TaxID=1314788 RepID=A0A6A6TPX8_9PLEO|nr:benzoate 4-monooxygenase cytochrome-like protein P450 [Lophiostoma macrostomum CBS 122681]
MFVILSHLAIYLGCSTTFLILAGIIKVFYNIYAHPLRKYPGPKFWGSSRLAWTWSMQSGYLHKHLHDFHLQYGPVVRIAPNELSYIDAQAWKDIYGPRHSHAAIEKNRIWVKQEEAEAHRTIVSVDEATHFRNRRALQGAFTEHAVTQHEIILQSIIGLMMQRFGERTSAGQDRTEVDIVEWLNFLAFDISGELTFGESFDCVNNGRAHPWVEISCSFGKGLALMASVNFFSPLDKLLRYAMPGHVQKKMEYHIELAKQKGLQRLAMGHQEGKQDYVGSILQYNEEKGEKIPKEEILENMSVIIFAGSETTSTSMGSILNQLMRNPEAFRKLEDEIRNAFSTEAEITNSKATKLEFLTAVIKEGLRLGPPAAIAIPRVIPKDGENICGRWVPGGTLVSVNQYPTFRSPSNFSQPDCFIPERWINSLPGDDQSSFHPFLFGRHSCIGLRLAWAEMRITLARLLFTFDVSPADDVKDFGEQQTFIFWQKLPLKLVLQNRRRNF